MAGDQGARLGQGHPGKASCLRRRRGVTACGRLRRGLLAGSGLPRRALLSVHLDVHVPAVAVLEGQRRAGPVWEYKAGAQQKWFQISPSHLASKSVRISPR